MKIKKRTRRQKRIRGMTIPKRKHLEKDNYEEEPSEKERIRKGESVKGQVSKGNLKNVKSEKEHLNKG